MQNSFQSVFQLILPQLKMKTLNYIHQTLQANVSKWIADKQMLYSLWQARIIYYS